METGISNVTFSMNCSILDMTILKNTKKKETLMILFTDTPKKLSVIRRRKLFLLTKRRQIKILVVEKDFMTVSGNVGN